MKFDNRTIQILKNFAAFNQSIQFKSGNVVTTISTSRSMFARATLTAEIPSDFAIYDLSRFLGVLTLFENPELQIEDKLVRIKGTGKNRAVKYAFASPETISIPTGKEKLVVEDAEITFTLSKDDFNEIMKASKILQVPEIALICKDNEQMTIQAMDNKNPTGDIFTIDVENACLKVKSFMMVFKVEYLTLLPDDYNVSIKLKSHGGLAHFKSKDIEYFIPSEVSSTYEA